MLPLRPMSQLKRTRVDGSYRENAGPVAFAAIGAVVVDAASDARFEHRLGDRGLAKTALAHGAERAGTVICPGEGGLVTWPSGNTFLQLTTDRWIH